MAHSRRSFLIGSTAGIAGLGSLGSVPGAFGATAKEKRDNKLQKLVEERIAPFRGEAGAYVRHLSSGKAAMVREDELFPTASMIKVAIMLAIFDKIERGDLSYHQELKYTGEYTYQGMNDDILSRFQVGQTIRLSKLIMLMITISDNSASIWLQQLAGGGGRINEVLESYGFQAYRMNSRTTGREDAYAQYGWGQTSPREICRMLTLIREGKAVSPAASEEMYRVLTRIYWSGEALSSIPPYVQTASKQGAVNRSRSEVVLVNAPHGDYVFSVISRNQQDESWGNDNEGFVLLRDLSRIFWDYFEPKSRWRPAQKSWNWDR